MPNTVRVVVDATTSRWREVGNVGSLTVAVEDGRVILGDLWALNAEQRERFMRLWCEAERQAETTYPRTTEKTGHGECPGSA